MSDDQIRARIFKAIYENCNLPTNRCDEITDAVLIALNENKEDK